MPCDGSGGYTTTDYFTVYLVFERGIDMDGRVARAGRCDQVQLRQMLDDLDTFVQNPLEYILFRDTENETGR